jgi:hypothetical protein
MATPGTFGSTELNFVNNTVAASEKQAKLTSCRICGRIELTSTVRRLPQRVRIGWLHGQHGAATPSSLLRLPCRASHIFRELPHSEFHVILGLTTSKIRVLRFNRETNIEVFFSKVKQETSTLTWR